MAIIISSYYLVLMTHENPWLVLMGAFDENMSMMNSAGRLAFN